MTGIAYGFGAPTGYAAQTFPATSPFAAYPFGTHPYGPQAQQHVQPLQQLLQIVPQQLQQLLQVVPQQLNQLQNVQQQVHHLQQLLQILPQQLYQLQQLVQSLPHHLLHQPFSGAPQPWGFTAAGQGVQPFGYSQPTGMLPQNVGFGAQPGQLM